MHSSDSPTLSLSLSHTHTHTPLSLTPQGSGRTNTELRELVGATTSPGLANAEFRRKTQTAINIKNEAFRRASAKEPDLGRTSKAPHSGRQETVITKRGSVQVVSKVRKSRNHLQSFLNIGGYNNNY